MATLAVNNVPVGGLSVAGVLVAATAGGDAAPTGPGLVLAVKNADAASHTVTLAIPGTVDDGQTVPSRAVTVAAGATELIPLRDYYRNPSTGLASITYDAVTSVTVGVLRVP